MVDFEMIAKQSAKIRREKIKLIPDNCKINPEYLGNMSNDEFIEVFKETQELFINIYKDIEETPFEWGYPLVNNTERLDGSAYNRILDFFIGLVENGVLGDKRLIVNSKSIPKCYDNKASFRIALNKHKKVEMIIDKLMNFGFVFEGYDKKAESFSVIYDENPSVLRILKIYAESRKENVPLENISYRWVEIPSEKKHEPIFLVKMDMSPIEIQQIQYWLYDKAKEYGYFIDKKNPFDKDCIHYTKGSKDFILVGEKHSGRMFSKVIFRNVFLTHPDKISLLSEKFPGVFGESYATCHRCNGRKSADKQCSMRICYNLNGISYENCAYQSFIFFNPTLDNFKDIFELFIIENKIK